MMNSAVIFVGNQKEYELASLMVNDKMLIGYCVKQLTRLDIDSIFLVGSYNFDINGIIKRNNINEVIEEIREREGKCLLLSPFYPLIKKKDYLRLLESENGVFFNEDIIPCFCINNKDIENFESLNYVPIELEKENAMRFENRNDVPKFWKIIKNRIVNKLMRKGVIIPEPDNVSIGIDVTIDKNTIVNPYVSISGTCLIGKDNVIGRNSNIVDSCIGDGNKLFDSKLVNSYIADECNIGPNAYISDSKLTNKVSIGSFVKLNNSLVSESSSIEHLSYISDCDIKENVRIGALVSTVNEGHNVTTIMANARIGSGVNLIAPVYIGEYGMVAAGSTIDKDVEGGDLAIARLYQQNKKGYGYKYTKEGAID